MDSSNENKFKSFISAIMIWIKIPHVVNRRLNGITEIANFQVQCTETTVDELIKTFTCCDFERVLKHENDISSIFGTFVQDFINLSSVNKLETCILSDIVTNSKNVYIVVQKLLAKNVKSNETFRFCILDTLSSRVIFINIAKKSEMISLSPEIPYVIQFHNSTISVEDIEGNLDSPKLKWLNDTLLPRLLKWIENPSKTGTFADKSLKLVASEKYNNKYRHLKTKYGQGMVKIWPENTDPAKFVFEDVAIATYLLLIWEEERLRLNIETMQSFVDLGCGNGLLVYILASEGHPGKGIDVRKRKIWDIYPAHVKLEVGSITPSEKCIYKDTDWLIGNHSDELTPWVPVIAARSSYNCRFFLLPCCAYEFDGKKYQRHDSSKSQYMEYLEYVQEICGICGIKTDVDRLKIPSTKRICFVGTDRTYSNNEHGCQIQKIQNFIDSKCDCKINSSNCDLEISSRISNDHWVAGFVPREGTEKVRNCTKIDKNLINDIVLIVANYLLKKNSHFNNIWNRGGCVSLNELVTTIPQEKLKELKKECGGLQTLLRNHYHVFESLSGKIKLRYPQTKEEVLKRLSNSQKYKGVDPNSIILSKKPCWFFVHHPDGCPLSAEVCSFHHIQ